MASVSENEIDRVVEELISSKMADLTNQIMSTTDENAKESLRAQINALNALIQRLAPLTGVKQHGSKESKPAPESKESVNQLEEAWKIEYKDPSSNTSRLYDHLNKCYARWRRPADQIFSPYFAVFQSSGHGKSRLLQHLCTSQKIPYLYICFRPVGSTGYPTRTPQLANFLTEGPSKEKWDAVLKVVLAFFCDSQTIEMDDSSQSTSPFEKWERFKGRFKAPGLEATICQEACSLLQANASISGVEVGKSTSETDSLSFLFVIDEARELVTAMDAFGRSSFRMLQRSLSSYEKGVFAILMDTLASIENFTPTVENDPSLRLTGKNNLLPPFHLVVTVDMFSEPPAPLGADQIRKELEPHNLVTKGRILWASTVLGRKRASRSNNVSTDKQLLDETDLHDWKFIVELAAVKLLGGQIQWYADSLSRVAALSVLSARAQVSIAPTSDSSALSVGSHLGTCVSISECQDAVFSMYPSEPAVAASAFRIVWGDDAPNPEHAMSSYAKFLSHLQSSFAQGIVDAGQCGELVARLLLNIAWDLSVGCLDKFYTMVSLQVFLNNLIGSERLQEAKMVLGESAILDAQLCFTHFIPVAYAPSEQELAKLMSRGAAVICQRNQVGVDLMIPLLLADGVISVFLISVKNHRSQFDKNWPSSAGSRVSLQTGCPKLLVQEEPGPPYFTLLMQLGAPTSMVFAGQHGQHSALAVFGLDTFCPSMGANHAVYRQLQAILKARQGLEGICFDELSAEVVPQLVPLHWTAEVRPRTARPVHGAPGASSSAMPDSVSSASSTSTSHAAKPAAAAFYLVDLLSRTRWRLDAPLNITTQEVSALFQQQGFAATILRPVRPRESSRPVTMNRVFKPVELSRCVCAIGEDKFVFLTITADEIGLVCTYPSSCMKGGVAVLDIPSSHPQLPDFVQTYLQKLLETAQKLKANKDRKRSRSTDRLSSETDSALQPVSKITKIQEETAPEHSQQ